MDNQENKIQIEKYIKEYQKSIHDACMIANSIRPHMLGGATQRELAVRTGWDMPQVEKCLRLLKSFKIAIFSEGKFYINFETDKIIEKINRECSYLHQRLFELDILQKHFAPEKESTSPEIAGTSELKNDSE